MVCYLRYWEMYIEYNDSNEISAEEIAKHINETTVAEEPVRRVVSD